MPSQRSQRYYVVVKGRKPGIYNTWIEAGPQVNGLNDAVHQSFGKYADALEIWEKAERSGWVEVLGGLPSSQNLSRASSRPLGPSVSLSALEDNRRSSNSLSSGTHYVVIRGREPGVYTTWIEASMHVKGVPDAIHQSFNSRDEAWRVYENARLRGEIEIVNDITSRQQSSRYQTANPSPELSTPPLTPQSPERKELPLVDDRDRADFSSRFGQLNISPEKYSSTNYPYRTASPATPHRGDGNTYTPPRRLTQHHSLPTTRFPSPDRSPAIARASSDRGASSSSPRTPQVNEEDSPRLSSRVVVGPPPGVKGYVPCKQLIPRTRELPLSPLTSSGLSLRSMDSPRLQPASYPSPGRKPSTDSSPGSPQVVTAAQSPSQRFSTPRSPPQAVPSQPFTPVSRSPQVIAATQSPRQPFSSPSSTPGRIQKHNGNATISPSIATSAHRPSQSFSSASSTPVRRKKGNEYITFSPLAAPSAQSFSSSSSTPVRSKKGDEDITFSPLPFDLSKGTSFLNGDDRRSRNSPSVSSLGLAPMPAPHTVYKSKFDPRSPMSKNVVVPLSMNSVSFGRPSPSYSELNI